MKLLKIVSCNALYLERQICLNIDTGYAAELQDKILEHILIIYKSQERHEHRQSLKNVFIMLIIH